MTYDQWIEKYKPIMDETDNAVLKDWHPFQPENKQKISDAIEDERIWTVLETDGMMWIAQGLHIVNRIAIVICEVSCPEQVSDICMWSEEDERELIMDNLNGLKKSFTYKEMKKLSLEELQELQIKHL